ncbi:hypothetical protein DWW13_04020 [Blautia sp. AF14-40]|nr:hypothetical protein DWW13_04020 [Blautia sp. AF14-40]
MTKTQIFLQNFCHGQICCPKTLESRKKPAENKQTAKAVCYLSRYSYSTVYAEASALTYTMVEMAKANGLNVYRYLEYLLEHRPNAKMTDEQLSELAPWSDSVKVSCQK